jgi:methionyl-tRNA formyltransferase
MSKIKLIYCTYPSIYSSIVLKQLLAAQEVEVVAIIHSQRIYKKTGSYLKNIYQLFCITGLKYLLYQFCMTDLFFLLSRFSKYKSTSYYAKKNQIPVLGTQDINQSTVIDFIKKQQPDLLLTIHFNQLLKEPLISLAPYGAINIHPSFLPYYKGLDPVFYQLLEKQSSIGVTVHQINENFDQGHILQQAQFKKTSNSLFLNNFFLSKQGGDLFLSSIKNKLTGRVQKELDKAHYDSWPNRLLIKKFSQNNFLIKGYGVLFKE